MSDLNVVAVITATSGSETEVRDLLTELVTATRSETGCISYELFESATAPGTFVTIERWSDQAAMDAHMQTDHVAAAFAAAEAHLSEAPAIHVLRPVAG